eukprot:TRINITY_DN28475_c0_g1_i1.p2 TRINITY_DN28475_c0_g1~~TRINITY_DN28475_c0_g1_i1.p2  ORF type:complete len:198 (-),score=-11.11 TRINITY_DN28475_c0_g1_i1:84-677(-)
MLRQIYRQFIISDIVLFGIMTQIFPYLSSSRFEIQNAKVFVLQFLVKNTVSKYKTLDVVLVYDNLQMQNSKSKNQFGCGIYLFRYNYDKYIPNFVHVSNLQIISVAEFMKLSLSKQLIRMFNPVLSKCIQCSYFSYIAFDFFFALIAKIQHMNCAYFMPSISHYLKKHKMVWFLGSNIYFLMASDFDEGIYFICCSF